MEFPPNLIPELIPEGFPPDRYYIGEVGNFSEQIEDQMLRRSYLWANALTIAGMETNLQVPSRLTGFSTGFIYVNQAIHFNTRNIRLIDGFSFGISLLISSEIDRRQELRILEVGSDMYPVIINYGRYVPHGLPTHPSSGSGSCWVENNQNVTWRKGILTCRHSLAGNTLGSKVTLHPSASHSTPNQGILADKDVCTIDAAIVEINQTDWPSGLLTLPICHAVAPGQSVSFEGRSSTQHGTVLRVFQHSGYIGNLFGQRVFTDCTGFKGDSGSLLVDRTSGEGLGIYMGTVPDGAGGSEGLFQHLSQAASYFGFSTYT